MAAATMAGAPANTMAPRFSRVRGDATGDASGDMLATIALRAELGRDMMTMAVVCVCVR